MYDPPKITDVLNFDTLISTVSGKNVKVIDNNSKFEALLKSKGPKVVAGFSNDIDYIITSRNDSEYEFKLAEIANLLGAFRQKSCDT